MKEFKKISVTLVLLVAIVSVAGLALASGDPFPTKPIKIIVPYKPGGGADTTARVFAKYGKEYFGKPLVVKNITGAAGSVGAKTVKDAKPDGYTLLWHANAFMASYHARVAKFRFDDLTPICQNIFASDVIVVRKDAPWNTIEELMNYIKKNPGKVRMGVNVGATTYFLGVNMAYALNAYDSIRYVAGGGDMDRTTKLLGGHIDVTPIVTSTVMEYIKSGKVKALASTSPARNPYLPKLPTFREKGYDVTSIKQFYVFGPPKLPEKIKNKIADTFGKLCKDKRIIDDFDKLKMEVQYSKDVELIGKMLEQDTKFYKLSRVNDIIKKRK
jgi:tripartite-type tricarboxylate transporter receptor subunit TctC